MIWQPLKGLGVLMRLLTSDLLEETAVTVNHRLYTAAERAAFPPKKIAVHRRPFLGDFLSTEPGYLDGTLHEPPPPYAPSCCSPGGRGLAMTVDRSYENIHFYGKSKKSKFLGISLLQAIFQTAYLSQFSTYRHETTLFGIVASRRFQRGVKRRPTPIQSRDIEQNVKVILPFLIPRSLILTIFTFCSISLDWIGV